MTKDWSSSKLVDALVAAGSKGMTKAALEKKIPAARRRAINSILSEIKSASSIRGPFKTGRSEYYFAAQFAPSHERAQALIDQLLRDAGLKLTTKSALNDRVTGLLAPFFKDALSSLKSELKVLELKAGRSTYYVHREPVLDQLRVTSEFQEAALTETAAKQPKHAAVTLDDVRPVYERLKASQGGVSTVKIYDLLVGLDVAKEDLHRLLLDEARRGRLTLHPASTVKFPSEVMAAGIRLPGEPDPLVTVILRGPS